MVNAATIDLIRRFEGLRLVAYRDAAGVWTIGYGHTSMAGPPKVTPGMRISRKQAERILRADVERVAGQVAKVLGPDVLSRLNENQFGALVSMAFNVGLGNFKRSSALRAVRAGRLEEVPRLLLRWVKSRDPRTGRLRTLRGLVRRRRAEGRMWLTPPAQTRPPLIAVAKHKRDELVERPDLSAAWAAFVAALVNLGIAAWHAAWQPALIGLGVVAAVIIVGWFMQGMGESDAAPVEPA